MYIARLASAMLLFATATGSAEAVTLAPVGVARVGATTQVVSAKVFGGSCYIGRGVSTFLRNGATPTAVVSIQEIVDSRAWDVSGQATLSFSSATSGYILFSNTSGYPANVANPAFSNFSQTYNGNQLTVTFTIAFPDCNLNFIGTYIN